MMEQDLVQLQRQDGVAWLVLNRPQQRNAIDLDMARALLARCQALADDSSVRTVVIRGAGASFGAGGDLAAMRADPPVIAGQLIDTLHEAVQILASLDAPVIASLHGAVAGGSLALAMACDLAIAADDTRFKLAYINLGASCDLSTSWHLPRLVGLRNAMALALLGEGFSAAEALRLGLVNQVVPQVVLEAATGALAQRLAQGPTLALGRTKRLLRASFDHSLPEQLALERENFVASSRTVDFKEGLDAFFARREPGFRGA